MRKGPASFEKGRIAKPFYRRGVAESVKSHLLLICFNPSWSCSCVCVLGRKNNTHKGAHGRWRLGKSLALAATLSLFIPEGSLFGRCTMEDSAVGSSFSDEHCKSEDESTSNGAPAGDSTDSPATNLRFLLSNTAAGSVIGKGGSTISDFQAQSGARIQLSRSHEYFPGTSDRVAVLSGSRNDVLAAFRLIMSKIIKDSSNEEETKSISVKLLVPKTVCGAIIGKGGSNIKKFVEESQASIKLSSQDQIIPGVIDRIVTVGGTLEQIIKAVTLILIKLTEESSYTDTASTPLIYSGLQNMRRTPVATMPTVAYGAPSVLSRGMMGPVIALQAPYQMALPVVEVGALTSSVTIGIPDEHIGLILGRAGKTLQEIQQTSGAKIKVSDRGDFVTGTEYRKVTMIGSGEAIQTAQFLLTQKVQQSMASDYERDKQPQPTNNSNNNSSSNVNQQ